jgi:hypothetical protein
MSGSSDGRKARSFLQLGMLFVSACGCLVMASVVSVGLAVEQVAGAASQLLAASTMLRHPLRCLGCCLGHVGGRFRLVGLGFWVPYFIVYHGLRTKNYRKLPFGWKFENL